MNKAIKIVLTQEQIESMLKTKEAEQEMVPLNEDQMMLISALRSAKAIEVAHEEGETVTRLAGRYGLSEGNVKKILYRQGVRYFRTPNVTKVIEGLSEQELTELRRRHDMGDDVRMLMAYAKGCLLKKDIPLWDKRRSLFYAVCIICGIFNDLELVDEGDEVDSESEQQISWTGRK